MVNSEAALLDYSNSINLLRQRCLASGLTDEEFRALYFETLDDVETEEQRTQSSLLTKRRLVISCIIVVTCVILNIKLIQSNLQEYIYPGLQILRKMSIPFISMFPSLTELYHETCLIQNPFFTVVDMECWPCSTISYVHEYDEPQPDIKNYYGQHAPFIYKTEQKAMKLGSLKNIYDRNQDTFNKESKIIGINFHTTPGEIFSNLDLTKNVYIWKFNTMNTARILRQVIPRPKVVPKFGQSTERFLIIDTSQNSFQLPDTECNFSFILALSGSRMVKLQPAEECKHQCKSLHVELKESYLLWYNWWYWKPWIQPSNGNETFITHIGSYCQ